MTTILAPTIEKPTAVVNGPKVGDILVSTYGYEVGNAHFAKVVAVTKASVKIELLGNIDNPTSPLTWESRPNVDSSGGEIRTKRFRACGDSYSVKDSSFSNFYPWSGKAINCYNYH
jgi:hypothetical protein